MPSLSRLGWISPIALGLSLIATSPAWAGATYRLTPPRMSFDPSGTGATRSFQVISTGDEPVAIEIHMTGRQVATDGTETQPDAEDDFLVYPSQIVLQPGESQTVRVNWLGDPNPDRELAYRIISEQLPIQLNQDAPVTQPTVKVTALFRYIGSVYITPRDAKSNVVLTGVSRQTSNGSDTLVLDFKNQGTAHQNLDDLTVTITSAGSNGQTAIQLTSEQLKGVSGENILAGQERQFIIPAPAGLPEGPLTGTFEIHPN